MSSSDVQNIIQQLQSYAAVTGASFDSTWWTKYLNGLSDSAQQAAIQSFQNDLNSDSPPKMEQIAINAKYNGDNAAKGPSQSKDPVAWLGNQFQNSAYSAYFSQDRLNELSDYFSKEKIPASEQRNIVQSIANSGSTQQTLVDQARTYNWGQMSSSERAKHPQSGTATNLKFLTDRTEAGKFGVELPSGEGQDLNVSGLQKLIDQIKDPGVKYATLQAILGEARKLGSGEGNFLGIHTAMKPSDITKLYNVGAQTYTQQMVTAGKGSQIPKQYQSFLSPAQQKQTQAQATSPSQSPSQQLEKGFTATSGWNQLGISQGMINYLAQIYGTNPDQM